MPPGPPLPRLRHFLPYFNYVRKLEVKLGRAGTGPRRQTLRLRGTLFFPQGIPLAAPHSGGAQLLVEDAGSGNVTVLEPSRFTTSVPPATAGACDPARDGWLVKPTRTIYRNRSSAFDPPTCTPGSAAGLNRLEYRPCGDRDLAVRVNVKQATLAAPLGSLRATLVLGST